MALNLYKKNMQFSKVWGTIWGYIKFDDVWDWEKRTSKRMSSKGNNVIDDNCFVMVHFAIQVKQTTEFLNFFFKNVFCKTIQIPTAWNLKIRRLRFTYSLEVVGAAGSLARPYLR
jgi:hypothetical protein